MVVLSLEEVREILSMVEEYKEFKERYGAKGIEDKPEFQQIIFYAALKRGEKFFVYERGGQDSKYDEARLKSKISVGVGGHIEPFDTNLMNSLYRELAEEVCFLKNGQEIKAKEAGEIKILGMLKDDTDEVGSVHLGLVCEVILQDPKIEVQVKGEENVRGEMVSFEEYQSLLKKGFVPEGWTEVVVEHLFGNSRKNKERD